MNKKDFYYDLPESLIAQTPVYPRDSSRLMVYDRGADSVSHEHFYDITKYLKKGDLLVVNRTRVLPARIYAKKTGSGGAMEFLLLKRLEKDLWECLVKPGKRAKIGAEFEVGEGLLRARVEGITEEGNRLVRFIYEGVFEAVLEKVGEMPLPPYIKRKLSDSERYQTVYSKEAGSAAAPTAGLHFTPELLARLREMGVEIAEVLLHVGLGTFRPVKEENLENHVMHSEHYCVPLEAAEKINAAKREGRRVIAVGTTSVRTLESVADEKGFLRAAEGDTQIFIYPPYRFRCVDALITNFHLPESTLIMLVSALMTREKTLELYETAVAEHYRFFSFGDAMMII
ncbi:MAG: tRNA preQ1(34) S-adenosylmethionine ribosyltransferase-isomerase QueA [Clostridia bacterium]|nr:tRNA preQ1(34) S-adenosylmethionine ribosyltransferase-isomerase QueA [Clostridia bacterium]